MEPRPTWNVQECHSILRVAEHACLLTEFYFNRPAVEWPLSSGGERSQFKVRAVAVASDPEALHGFLLEGVGLFMTNHVRVKSDVAAGRLVRVLPEWAGPEPTLYAIQPGGGVQPPRLKHSWTFSFRGST